MRDYEILLKASDKNFKASSKEIRKAIKNSINIQELELTSERLKDIASKTIQSRIKTNIQTLANIHSHFTLYSMNLENARNKTQQSTIKYNYNRRLKYATKIHEELSIKLYKLNLELSFLLEESGLKQPSRPIVKECEME